MRCSIYSKKKLSFVNPNKSLQTFTFTTFFSPSLSLSLLDPSFDHAATWKTAGAQTHESARPEGNKAQRLESHRGKIMEKKKTSLSILA